MSALLTQLLTRITRDGPMSVADYMAECLLNPAHGYYATRDPFGAQGDFTTAPEISQMFGELLGLCLAQSWLDQGAPASFVLAEPGPGRGTLMADVLRATAAVPGFNAAAHLHLIEASPALRKIQRKTLAGSRATWHDQISDLPEGPLFLIANEFFDALPIRQYVRSGDGWRERRVGVTGGALAFGAGQAVPIPELEHRLGDTRQGDLVETCAPAGAIVADIARRVATHGGVAILIDYGGWRSFGDTLQALKAHATAPVLEHPGEADLTAHVDFGALSLAAHGGAKDLSVTAMTPQGVLLERLGITERARKIAGTLARNPDQ
ncbi:MAG: class I SAM-dependent methyltransferase, partial [Halocynthiibacter sp.]